MDSIKPNSEAWSRLARGIEAGIFGGAAMMAVLIVDSLLDNRYWWYIPNLLGSTFYGPRAFRAGAGLVSLSGLALNFVIAGTLGGLFGLAFSGIYRRGRMMLLGVIISLGWYTLANAIFWPRVNPWVAAASPRSATVLSYIVLGACFGIIGQRSRPEPVVSLTSSPMLEPAYHPEELDQEHVPDHAPDRASDRAPDHAPDHASAAGSSDAIE